MSRADPLRPVDVAVWVLCGLAAIFGLWSTVLVAGVVAAAVGKAFIGSTDALMAIFAQALAGGAVLALVAHAMIPVALEEGGSLVVLPTVAGFLFAFYLLLVETLPS